MGKDWISASGWLRLQGIIALFAGVRILFSKHRDTWHWWVISAVLVVLGIVAVGGTRPASGDEKPVGGDEKEDQPGGEEQQENASEQKAIAAAYARFRDELAHESVLINQRMTWLLTSQGALLSGNALLLYVKATATTAADTATTAADTATHGVHAAAQGTDPFSAALNTFTATLPIVGIGTAALILLGVLGALWAQHNFHRGIDELAGCDKAHFPQRDRLVDGPMFLGDLTAVLTPVVFIAIWLALS